MARISIIFVTLAIFSLIFPSFALNGSQRNLQFVKTFLSNFQKPIHLDAYLCWNDADLYSLSKVMSAQMDINYRVISTQQIELAQGEMEDNSLVLMDFGCLETLNFLETIQWKQYENMMWLILNAGTNHEIRKELVHLISVNNMGPASELYLVAESTNFSNVKQGKFNPHTFLAMNRNCSSINYNQSYTYNDEKHDTDTCFLVYKAP